MEIFLPVSVPWVLVPTGDPQESFRPCVMVGRPHRATLLRPWNDHPPQDPPGDWMTGTGGKEFFSLDFPLLEMFPF